MLAQMITTNNEEGMVFAGIQGEGCYRLGYSHGQVGRNFGFFPCEPCVLKDCCPCQKDGHQKLY